jgi:hypothetical protein
MKRIRTGEGLIGLLGLDLTESSEDLALERRRLRESVARETARRREGIGQSAVLKRLSTLYAEERAVVH